MCEQQLVDNADCLVVNTAEEALDVQRHYDASPEKIAVVAPGAAVATLVGAIVTDARRLIPCCVYLDGEYGEHDLCIGVPVILGAKGVERIVDVDLEGSEKEAFAESVRAARETNAALAETLG